MSALKTELKNKLETFKSVGISFDNINPENNEDWQTWNDDNTGEKVYYHSDFNLKYKFNTYEDYKYYKDKLKSLNIILSDNTYLFQ
jgi:hypothetical protein